MKGCGQCNRWQFPASYEEGIYYGFLVWVTCFSRSPYLLLSAEDGADIMSKHHMWFVVLPEPTIMGDKTMACKQLSKQDLNHSLKTACTGWFRKMAVCYDCTEGLLFGRASVNYQGRQGERKPHKLEFACLFGR